MTDQQKLKKIIDTLEPARALCDELWNSQGPVGEIAAQLIRVERELRLTQAMARVTISEIEARS